MNEKKNPNKMKVLLLEGIHSSAVENFEQAGFQVDLEKAALGEKELIEKLSGYQALGIRSKTQVSTEILKSAQDILVVGAFCIGTNQINLEEANLIGVPVFNAPYSNTRSVAELVICEMIALSRELGDRNSLAHKGIWKKSAKGSFEIRGKKLGIVGYGHIGSQLSVLAESMGLKVSYYDVIKKLPLGNSTSQNSLQDLLQDSDFVSLHVPETDLTKNMVGADELALMKKGSYLINASRGSVVDIPALSNSLKNGHLAGAAVDVFPEEPKSNKDPLQSELMGLDNVILTPHIGGSTEEAQVAIGQEVSTSIIKYLKYGSSYGAVNFPNLDVQPKEGDFLLLNIHKNIPGVLSEINKIVSDHEMNIQHQMLATDSNLGYLMMTLEGEKGLAVTSQVQDLGSSVKTRFVQN